jgi:SAM-dependent methyltransferase
MKAIVVFLLIVPLPLLAQTDTTAHHSMIKGLVSYRNELIARNPKAFQRLWQMEQLWKEPDQESVNDFVTNVVFANQLLGMSPVRILKKYLKYEPDFKLTHLLKEETIQAILENGAWMALLINGYLKPNPPFNINSETGLFEELSFYKIKNGMRLAELGAGDGTFSLLLTLAFDSLHVYVNDINPDAVQYSSLSINACKSCRPSNHFYCIQGKKKSTGLESVQLDKIIIRNSFHHFSNQPDMLAAIQQSLMPDGDLYITDPTIQPGKAPDCPKAMKPEEIRAVLSANGFVVLEEKQLKDWGWVMLHCKPQ